MGPRQQLRVDAVRVQLGGTQRPPGSTEMGARQRLRVDDFHVQRGGTRLLEFKETGDPLLIVDTLGEGRLACFTSDILPHWGSPRFVEWDAYLDFWEQFFRWLAGK